MPVDLQAEEIAVIAHRAPPRADRVGPDCVRITPGSPTLVTLRLRLRHVQPEDAAFLHRLCSEESFMARCTSQLSTREAVLRYIDWSQDYGRERGLGVFLIESRPAGHALGICTLAYRRETRCDDIGFAIDVSARNRGYASEAALALLSLAWDHGLTRVTGITLPGNEAARAILHRIGLRDECERRYGDRTWLVSAIARPAPYIMTNPWL